MKNKCDILIPLFFFQGRDVEAIIPLKFFLEKYFDYKVEVCSIFDPFIIHLKKPKLILMENTIGSKFHVRFAHYAHQCKYPLISLISEGIVTAEQGVEQGVWGHNKSKKIYFDKLLTWNKEQTKLIATKYPQLKKKMEIGGTLGFDRYKIYHFMSKKNFLKKYKKIGFKTVIGYAGFVFSSYFTKNSSELEKGIGRYCINNFKKDRREIRLWLESTIKKHPKVLFILKQHPGESSSDMEISKKWEKQYKNVCYFQNEEPVANLINVSDLWMVYDSTTSLEAWLLGKPTLTLMPSKNLGVRNNFYQGNLTVSSSQNLDKRLQQFIKNKNSKIFLKNQPKAKKILQKMIHCGDGMNFIRTAVIINHFLKKLPVKKNHYKKSINIYYLFNHFCLLLLTKISFLPLLKKSVILNWFNEYPQFKILEKKYQPFLQNFTQKNEQKIAKIISGSYSH